MGSAPPLSSYVVNFGTHNVAKADNELPKIHVSLAWGRVFVR